MKRVGRIILNALTVLSMVLCVAMVGLWVRSYSGADSISRRWMTVADSTHSEHRSQEIQWTQGSVRFLLRHDSLYYPSGGMKDEGKPYWTYFRYGVGYWGQDAPPARDAWARFGFAAWPSGFTSSFAEADDRVWAVPAWAIAAMFAVAPGWKAWGLIRRGRRRAEGRCARCRYNLTGNVSGVCPECGMAIADGKSQIANLK